MYKRNDITMYLLSYVDGLLLVLDIDIEEMEKVIRQIGKGFKIKITKGGTFVSVTDFDFWDKLAMKLG